MLKMKEINEIHTRRYNLINSAIEIFSDNGRTYFFNIYAEFLQ